MSVLNRLKPWRYRRQGQTPEATSAASRPDLDAALRDITRAAAERRYADALGLVRTALAAFGDHRELVATRGSILFEWGRYREAAEDLAAAVAAGIDRPTLLIQLGWSLLWSGNAAEAERSMRRAAFDGAEWRAHFGLGSVLRGQGRLDEAVGEYRKALELSPDDAECLAEIVGCHVDARQFDDGLEIAERLRNVHSSNLAALSTYGALLIWHDRFAEANAVYEHIAAMDPVRSDPLRIPLDTGFALREGGRVAESLAFYERHLPMRPEPNACAQYAFTLLKAGRLREGFAQYEFRWMIQPLLGQRLRHGRPQWRGQPLSGKTLLVVGEQGYGDVIQFLRYLPVVKQSGGRVILLLRKPMSELIDAGLGVDQVIQLGESIPDFDYSVPLLGLAHVYGTEVESIPQSVPYIRAQPGRIAQWRSRIAEGDGLNIGIVWAGDPLGGRGRQKSMTLATLAPWGRIPGVRFYSLQKGDAAAEAAEPPTGLPLTDLSTDIHDFADTAAIIASLDLVISVCTSVTHLAGAMGKPTWTLLPEPADWRWLENRDDTPWYPTMRLFRQTRQGDWTSVVERVGRELEALARGRRPATDDSVAQEKRVTTGATHISARAPSPAEAGPCAVVEARHGLFQVRPEGTPGERSLRWYGEDLESQLDLVRTQIGPGATVLEVGSGVGSHAIPLVAHIGSGGHLLVCEPRPELAVLLHNNLRTNGVQGVTTLRTNLLGAASVGAAQTALNEDAIAPIDRLGLRKLHLLKINEGIDTDAILAGAAETFWALRPTIFAAAPDEQGAARLGRRLRDFGYHCWRVDTPRFSPDNFNHREDDIFSGAVVHAILAIPEESTAASPAGLTELT